MNNYRYDKLNMIIHLQHQKSHYRRIIQAKKNIDFKSIEQSNVGSVSHNHKYSLSKDRERKQNNHKLVTKINQINNKNGLLQDIDAQAKRKQLSMKYNGALSSSIGEEKINRDNMKLAQRLQEAKPMVGTRSEWKTHFKKFKSYHRMIQKYGKDRTYDPEVFLRDTLSSLSKGKKKECMRFSSLGHRVANTQNEEPIQISEASDNQSNEKQIQYIKSRRNKNKRMLKTSQNRRTRHGDMPANQSQELKLQINQIILRDEYRSEMETYKNRSKGSNQQL